MSLNSEAEVTEILIDGISIPLKGVTVYDGLDSTNTEYCLSANQGKVLNEKIDTTLTSANTYTDNKVAELVGEAPDTLNTLDELSEALKDNKDVVTVLEEAIANKVDKVEGKVLSTNDYTTEEKEKLASLENYDDTQVKLLINGKVNQETLTNYYNKTEIDNSLNNKVDNSVLEENITSINNSIPTKTSQLTNDSNFLSSIPDDYITETELTNKGFALASNIPTKVSQLDNDAKYLTSIPTEYITETELNAKGYITGYTETDPTVPSWAKASSKPTYTYNEITNKPSVKYLHKIELSLINSAHNTTASIWLDYWSTASSIYSSVQFVTHSSLSTALPCTGTVGGASGMSNAYCITILNSAVIVNKNTEIDINSSCTITDNIVGYMFYN